MISSDTFTTIYPTPFTGIFVDQSPSWGKKIHSLFSMRFQRQEDRIIHIIVQGKRNKNHNATPASKLEIS